MKTLSTKDLSVIGLMLFALFFGAGNLIFPPFLGIEAGENFWPAIIGFVAAGVGLPVLAVLAISLAKGGVQELGNRVHPMFGLIFTAVVYLSVGPLFAIPRSATVAFEMGAKPFLPETNLSLYLFLFTVVYFAVVFWVCLNPTKIVDRIGSLLTPLLLITIGLLAFGSFFKLDGSLGAVSEKYESAPFFTGFLEGYLTMDTIGALAFGIVIVSSIRAKGITDQKVITGATWKAGVIAGIGLALVYIIIGYLGAKMASHGTFTNGAEILIAASKELYGSFGLILLGSIVTLACFTTAVGLVTATSQYFQQLMPNVSYKVLVSVTTIVSFGIANLGLNQIIAVSIPVLIIIYPLAIVVVLFSLFNKFYDGNRGVYAGAMIPTALISIYDGLKPYGLEMEGLTNTLNILPFYAEGMGWVVPALVGAAVGYILFKSKKQEQYTNEAPATKAS